MDGDKVIYIYIAIFLRKSDYLIIKDCFESVKLGRYM